MFLRNIIKILNLNASIKHFAVIAIEYLTIVVPILILVNVLILVFNNIYFANSNTLLSRDFAKTMFTRTLLCDNRQEILF